MAGKTVSWALHLMLVNDDSGDAVDIVYPSSRFHILEQMNKCRIPYGSGRYHHMARTMDDYEGDCLQKALSHAIENKDSPPSIKEMNYLAETIQKMSARQRVEFEKAVSELTTIRESVDIAGKMVGKNFPFTELSETNRAELWNEDDPYFRIRFVQDGERWFEDEHGVWVDFPATDDELQRAAAVMGVHSLQELRECQVDGVVKCGSSLTLKDINRWAKALKECHIGEQLGKYKAVLDFEDCTDLEGAMELAAKIDEYEFFPMADFDEILDKYQSGASQFDYDEQMDLADELGIGMTEYGIVKKSGQTQAEEPCLRL